MQGERLAVDVIHHRSVPYLAMVECGLGRFAIWRQLKNETAENVIAELGQIFYETGPVNEALLDNATYFRSAGFAGFLEKWNVLAYFRAAYHPSSNGIVERNHIILTLRLWQNGRTWHLLSRQCFTATAHLCTLRRKIPSLIRLCLCMSGDNLEWFQRRQGRCGIEIPQPA